MSGERVFGTKVVIAGAGFGGLYCARALGGAPVDLLVIDRRNYHLFQPLLYQVATAGLNPSDIARPIRRILRKQSNTRVLLGEAASVDLAQRRLQLAHGEAVAYDYLVMATGATHSYFGHDQWAPHAPGLKGIEDALDIRRRILTAFEAAEMETDPQLREAWMTFVIVGGGPTGVELAGSIAELARRALAQDFRAIDTASARVVLVEAQERILPTFSERSSRKAAEQLERLGVEIRTGAPVTGIDEGVVEMQEGSVAARTALWAAGVAASPLAASLEVAADGAGRVMVEADLSVPGHPEVFVIGDLAHVEQDSTTVPGVAPAAMQMAAHVASNIKSDLGGKPRRKFRYRDKGMLTSIGRHDAVADLRRLKLSGFPAWVIWVVVHIYFLIGFRNRLLVMIEWAWAYFTWERGARLITGPPS